jgi:DNA modification methylase
MNRVVIGSAVLYLGDAREIIPTLGPVDAVVTDPAYGINAARDRKSQKHGWRDYDGNYWTDALPRTSKWLSWDKGQTDFSLADFELAWCSFDGAARRITYSRSKALQDGKEHPTQKPIEVMRWCIDQLPNGCTTILDPFMGSGTTGVAAVKLGKAFIGIEINTKFFDIACRRVDEAQKQQDMFVERAPVPKQQSWDEMWSHPFVPERRHEPQ